MRVIQRLQSRGHEAYLVGGCVRDLLLGRQPKDFDIATGARPQQVKRTFPRNCRIIGRRFKLAHLHFRDNSKILEVATFRGSPVADRGEDDDLLITRDNEFGTAEEDAVRRDFTVNALFLDPVANAIIDYAGGLADIEDGVLRTIGEPIVRFREDPVRIVRAAKFAGRLGLRVDDHTYEGMAEVAPDLQRSAPPRLLEEVLRLLRGGHSLDSFQILRDVGALKVILPVVAEFLGAAPETDRVRFWRTLDALDHLVLSGSDVPNPVLLGALFESPVRVRVERDPARSPTTIAEDVIGPFAEELRLPRRDAGCLKRICGVQPRFLARGRRRFQPESFLRDPFFPEALLLFELTSTASGEGLDELRHWKGLARGQGADADELANGDGGGAMAESSPEGPKRKRRRRRRGRKTAEADTPSGTGVTAEGAEPAADGEREREPASAEGDAEGRPERRKRRRRRRGEGEEHEAVAEKPDAPDPAEAEGAAADGGDDDSEAAPRKRRRRRRKKKDSEAEAAKPAADAKPGTEKGRKKTRGKAESEREEAETGAAPKRKAKTKTKAKAKSKSKSKTKAKSTGQEQGKQRESGKASGKKTSGRKRTKHRKEESVEVIEPDEVDVSAFDLELGPRDVPSFGVIVDQGERKKRRPARIPPGEQDYKPPPPPTGGDPEPPPPPPADDEFGDW